MGPVVDFARNMPGKRDLDSIVDDGIAEEFVLDQTAGLLMNDQIPTAQSGETNSVQAPATILRPT